MAQYNKSTVHYARQGRSRTVFYRPTQDVSPVFGPWSDRGMVVMTDTFDGATNPKWRSQVKRGSPAGTDAFGTTVSRKRSSYGSAYWEADFMQFGQNKGRQWRLIYGDHVLFDTVFNSTSPDTSSADNAALTKMYAKMHSATQGLQGLVALGEIGQTLRMIRSPAEALKKGLYKWVDDSNRIVRSRRRVRRGAKPLTRRLHIANLNKSLADSWLERTFGWNPLMADIQGGAKALDIIRDRRVFPQTLMKSLGRWDAPTQVGYTSPLIWGSNTTGQWYRNRTYSVRYLVCMSLEPRTWYGNVAESFGVMPKDFLPTVWELIPYSFLIDYFSNIGNLVTSWSVHTERVKWIVKTVRDVRINDLANVTQSSYFSAGTNETYRMVVRPSATLKATSFQRTNPASLSHVGLEFTVPGFGSMKWANIAALVLHSRSIERGISHSLRI